MLTFPRTTALVGALPRLNPVVADTIGCLKGGDSQKLSRRIKGMQRRFPQLTVQVVIHRFPAEYPFTMHAFWLFNAGALAGEFQRGKDNRALLVVVDPFRQESAIVPGYALEPLLEQESLDHLLEMSSPAFGDGKWLIGFEVLLDGLEMLLETVSNDSEVKVYGVSDF
jgi:uncharacterized membrane protein YgcG